MSLLDAFKEFKRAGGVFVLPPNMPKHYGLDVAAAMLDVSRDYLREHLEELCPHAWRLPGGEIRVPHFDIANVSCGRGLFEKAK